MVVTTCWSDKLKFSILEADLRNVGHNTLGDLYRKQERYEEAIGAYEQAIQLAPKNAKYHNPHSAGRDIE